MIRPCFLVLSIILIQNLISCTTFKPIPTSRINESVVGSDDISNVQFGGVYHFTPTLYSDKSSTSWGVDAFYDTKWPLFKGVVVGSPFLSLKLSPFQRPETDEYSDCFNIGVDLGQAISLHSRFSSFIIDSEVGYEAKWKLDDTLYLHQNTNLVISQFDRIGLVPFMYTAGLALDQGTQINDHLAIEAGIKYSPSVNIVTSVIDLRSVSASFACFFDYLKFVRLTTLFVYSPFEVYSNNIVLGSGSQYTMNRYISSQNRVDLHVILGWYY